MATPTLVALHERIDPIIDGGGDRGLSTTSAVGSLAVVAKHGDVEQYCATQAIYQLATNVIPEAVIDADPANRNLLEVAASIAAGNWLRPNEETPLENQLMADVLIGIFTAIPSRRIGIAGYDLQKQRELYGPGKRAFDTTHRLVHLFRGFSLFEPGSKGRVESRLQTDQLQRIETILQRGPASSRLC